MNTSKLKSKSKTFLTVNFGCRVNATETNQWSQVLIDQGYTPYNLITEIKSPDILLVNTCSITKKAEKESLNKIKYFHHKYPNSKIYVTGCANVSKIKNLEHVSFFTNQEKEKLLKKLKSYYTPEIKDKFSHTNRFLLKIQSGCTQFCSYCIVPFKRNYLFSLSPTDAIKTVNKAIKNGYKEVVITGVNIDEYQYGLSNLIKLLLEKTEIKLISFGSIPLNCISKNFINLYQQPKHSQRLSHFLHIPIQSGSDKILKLMNRPYTKKEIIKKIDDLKSTIDDLKLGTDIIVGFPTETDSDFQKTLKLCQQIGFSKIHVFPFSPRPGTKARIIFENSPKISKEKLKERSQKIRAIQLLTN